METLRLSDQRKISAFVRELYRLHSVKTISIDWASAALRNVARRTLHVETQAAAERN